MMAARVGCVLSGSASVGFVAIFFLATRLGHIMEACPMPTPQAHLTTILVWGCVVPISLSGAVATAWSCGMWWDASKQSTI